MSRVGRKPIDILAGVKATISGSTINIEGPKGKLEYTFDNRFKASLKNNKISIQRPSDNREDASRHGLIRSLIHNMVIGVTKGYTKELEIKGVGFKAQVQGKKLTMQLGYSHPIIYDAPEGITIQAPKPTQIVVSGIDKAKVGEVASELREFYLAEPYKGKGIRYAGEYVRHKAGKTVA
ncbi:MAG: 50S ribosomal protein L6 [Candidatus Omnitrophica bacterium]|nr:50S ribosomal protein L6 [Candidatus Omnitrophota bacterium]